MQKNWLRKDILIAGLCLIALSVIIFVSSQYFRIKQQKPINNPQPIKTTESTKENCWGYDIFFDDTDPRIKTNLVIKKVLEKACYGVFKSEFIDLTGDGKEEILLSTIPAGCASCHPHRLYVFSNDNKILLEKQTEDGLFRIPEGKSWDLEIKEAIRYTEESYCCPSDGLVWAYKAIKPKNSSFDYSLWLIKVFVEPYKQSNPM